jgi:hypothetical protein
MDKRKKPFNEYKIIGETTEIYVIRKDGTQITFLIDTEDLPMLIKLGYRWCSTYDEFVDNYYATSSQVAFLDEQGRRVQRTVLLHEIIMGVKYIDHINNDTKNNKKNNLRPTTHSPNLRNRRGKNSNNKSGYRNVCWIKTRDQWVVQLQIDGKNTRLAWFDDVDEAGRYAEEMRQKYYGEFAGKS